MKQVMVGIIGGGMRAVEACYLAHQAEYEVTVFDNDPMCAAAGLADVFVCADLHRTDVSGDLEACDFLLPVMDADAVPARLMACAQACGVPLLHGRAMADAALLRAHAIPCVSQGLAHSGAQVYALLPRRSPVYAIQVIGDGQLYVPLAVTRILSEAGSRRCCVEAGAALPQGVREQMQTLGQAVGAALHLRGICTVEAVWQDGRLCVSAVDTRLPSRMPSVVYRATGLNMLALLYDVARGRLAGTAPQRSGYAACRSIAVDGAQLRAESGRAMARDGRLQYAEYFFGCPEALTRFRPGRQAWGATLIAYDADSMDNVYARLDRALGRIAQHTAAAAYQPAAPARRVV